MNVKGDTVQLIRPSFVSDGDNLCFSGKQHSLEQGQQTTVSGPDMACHLGL